MVVLEYCVSCLGCLLLLWFVLCVWVVCVLLLNCVWMRLMLVGLYWF